MQPIKLRLLVLEDVANDAELEIAELQQAGYECEWKRVETREDFLACLDTPDYELILSDYALPAFDGLTALSLLQERKVDIPFILVSGTLGEDAAIDSLKAGAVDYVLKTRLSRLAPVVTRALKEQAESLERKRMQQELQSANERFRAIMESAADAIITMDSRGQVMEWNPAAQATFGYSFAEMLGREVVQILPERLRTDTGIYLNQVLADGGRHIISHPVEVDGCRKDGSEFSMELSLTTWAVGGEQFFTAVIRDITVRKQAEGALQLHNQELEQFNKLATGRELRMIELKKEINALCRELGREEPYA